MYQGQLMVCLKIATDIYIYEYISTVALSIQNAAKEKKHMQGNKPSAQLKCLQGTKVMNVAGICSNVHCTHDKHFKTLHLFQLYFDLKSERMTRFNSTIDWI